MKRMLALFLVLPLSAQNSGTITVNPNRPSFATPADTTQEGVLEWEAGFQRSLYRSGARSDFEPILWKLGQTSHFEWRLGWNGHLTQTAPEGSHTQGLTDPTFGFQWHPLDQDRVGFDGSIGYFHKFPTANAAKGLGSGRADDTLVALASKDLGPVHVDVNLLQGWLGQPDGSRAGQTAAVVSTSWSLPGPWGMGAELYSVGPAPGFTRDTAALVYVSYQVSSRLVLDAGSDHGLSTGAPRWDYFFGVTYGLGRLFPPKVAP